MNSSPDAALARTRSPRHRPVPFPARSRSDIPSPLGLHIPIARPPGLAIDEPPRGRVLIVDDDAAQALELQSLLRAAGYRVCGPVATLPEIERLIERGGIDCAIIDCAVNERTPLPVADLLDFADIPFVFLASPGEHPFGRHVHRPRLARPVRPAQLRDAVERAMRRRDTPANDNRLPEGRVAWPRIFPQL